MEKELTESQKKKFEHLIVEARAMGTRVAIKSALLLGVMAFGTILANQLFVQREEFVFLMAMISGIMSLTYGIECVKEGQAIIKEKAQRILDEQ